MPLPCFTTIANMRLLASWRSGNGWLMSSFAAWDSFVWRHVKNAPTFAASLVPDVPEKWPKTLNLPHLTWSVHGNLSILFSAFNLKPTPNPTLKRLRSWSPGLREQDVVGEKTETSIYRNQVSYGWSPKTHNKIWPKSAQNRPLCTKPWISVEVSFSLNSERSSTWNCEGKRFQPCFFKSYRWVS